MHQGPKEAGWVGTRLGMWRIISSWQLDCRPELCQYVTQHSTNLQTSKLHSIHSQPAECYGYHGTVEILHITICSSRARVSLPLLSDVFSFEWLHICDVWCSLISYFIILCEVALLIIELQLLAFKTFSGDIGFVHWRCLSPHYTCEPRLIIISQNYLVTKFPCRGWQHSHH